MKAIEPNDVITLWIALDDTKIDAGTLEYVRGSHKWPLDQSHIPKDFFSPTDYRERLESMSKSISGHNPSDSVVPVIVEAGGGSLHSGKLLHGSGPNNTVDWTRRSLAIHFIPSDSTFSQHFPINYIYGRYKKFGSSNMDEDFFPITWSAEGHRSHFIRDYIVHYAEITL
jgi:phytanoyl-CoA hydroxylase